MNRWTGCIRVILAATGMILAGGRASAQGTPYAGSFLEIPVGARALGLGGAYASLADDGSAFHWNPAGVSLVEHKLLSGMYSSQYGAPGSPMANFYHAGWTMPVSGLGVAFNWVRFAVNDIAVNPDLRNVTSLEERYRLVRAGGSGETFADIEDAFILSFARNTRLDIDLGWSYFKFPLQIPLGVNMKIIRQSLLDNTASGIGIDAGGMVRVNLRDFFFGEDWPELSVGISVRDVGGTKLNWNRTQRNETIGQSTTLGVSIVQPVKIIDSRVTLSGDFSTRYAGDRAVGLELKYKRQFSVRFGADASTLCAGAGVDFNFFDVDYAYLASSQTQLGQVHRIGLALDFDKLLEKSPR